MKARAWIYISCVWAVALAAAIHACWHANLGTPDWTLVELLFVGAIAAQLLKVEAPNHVLFYTSPIFYFTGVMVLSPPFLLALIVIPHLVEWGREKWSGGEHLGAWYLQPFNIAMFWLACRGAQALFIALHFHHESSLRNALVILMAALAYVLINHALLGCALVLARGISWRESGVFDGGPLLNDFALLCSGALIAVLWPAQPWLSFVALTPVVFMYQALMVPQLKRQAEMDAKTGVYNARHFSQLFEAELDRARRFDRPMAFIMADLDLLREINNTYGHLAGDAVLTGIGEIIRSCVRDYDIAGRFGGEEFALVLPEVDEEQARVQAERLRRTIEAASFTVGGQQIHATMSLGIACFPHDATSASDLMEAADTAVYAAKASGRNRVVACSEVPAEVVGPVTPPAEVSPTPRLAPVQAVPESPPSVEHEERRSRSFATFLTGVILAGPLVTLLALFSMRSQVPTAIILLAAIAIASEWLEVELFGQGTVSVSVGVAFGAAILMGVSGLAVVSAVVAIVHHIRQKRGLRDLYRAAFNWSVHVLAGAPAAFAVHLLHVHIAAANLVALVVLTVAGAYLYFWIETGLVASATALARGDNPRRTWNAHYRWLVGHYIVLCLMGLALAITYVEVGPLGDAIFVLPFLMMHYAQRQSVVQTRANIQTLQRLNRDLLRAALHDHLTGLGNERGYQEALRREMTRSIERSQTFTLARINIDDFKSLNIERGRRHGDHALVELASILRGVPRCSQAFRLTADEFAVLLMGGSANEARAALDDLRALAPDRLGGITISIGMAVLDGDGRDADELHEQAIDALLAAKRRGRDTVVDFEEIRSRSSVATGAQAHGLRRLLAEGRLEVAFQPIWDMDRGTVLGYEALGRPHRDYGLVGPQEAFDLATRVGRAHELDALCRAAILAQAHELPPSALLFMNVAPESLEQNRLSGVALLAAVTQAGLRPQQVVLELTERSITRPDDVVNEAEELRSYGFRLALDDTGAGNAGLGVLSRLHVDFVKVDRAVITYSDTDQSARAVLAGIFALAREMGAYVITEGVEDIDQLSMIRELSPAPQDGATGYGRGVQGYLLGRPSNGTLDPLLLAQIAAVVAGGEAHRHLRSLPKKKTSADLPAVGL